jgi:predicted TIM-barrel fold metal-dependent hydrolase
LLRIDGAGVTMTKGRPCLCSFAALCCIHAAGLAAQDLPFIDAHSHDAPRAESRLKTWDEYGVARVVLFGAISESAAVATDRMTWAAYERHPDRIIPFFAGLDLHDPSCLVRARENFEKGYLGVGEIVAASTQSPITSKLKWKGLDPMDGYLPALYDLCAEYKAPILLHIDPPRGTPIMKLEEALDSHPATVFILGHANVFTLPADLERLMRAHPNLYIDFYAGYTAFDARSALRLDDFVPLIEEFPSRVVVGSDSGTGITIDEAYEAIRTLLGKLRPATATAVASGNIERILDDSRMSRLGRSSFDSAKR